MIKVLYITHLLSFNLYGGVEVKMNNYMDAINENEDFEVKLFDMWNDNIEDYDVIHLFNVFTFPAESLLIVNFAKERNIKVVVSPIFYINYKDMNGFTLHFLWKVFILLRNKFNFIKIFDPYRSIEELMKISDRVVPNTMSELDLLSDVFSNVSREKFILVHNEVEKRFKNGDPSIFNEKYGLNDFILFVGRVEIRKNVLKLIRAFVKSDIDTNLVILGKVWDKDYYELCVKECNDRVIFLPPAPHDSEIFRSAYKAAKVLVLPSFLETPGRVALEGGLAGANVVITEVGGTEDYFDDYAWYVDPSDENDIKVKLLLAYNESKSHYLSEHIEKNFTVEIIAEKYADLYKSLID